MPPRRRSVSPKAGKSSQRGTSPTALTTTHDGEPAEIQSTEPHCSWTYEQNNLVVEFLVYYFLWVFAFYMCIYHSEKFLPDFLVPYLSCGNVTPAWALTLPAAGMFVYWTNSLHYLFRDIYADNHGKLNEWKHVYSEKQFRVTIDYALYTKALRMIAFELTPIGFIGSLGYFQFMRLYREEQICNAEFFPSVTEVGLVKSVLYLVGLVCGGDFIFYTLHRLAHEIPWVYNNVHKVHHEFVQTYGICATASHWVETVFINMSTLIVPAAVMGMPFGWALIWVCLGNFNTVNSHSGYKNGGFPLMSSRPHDEHHKYFLCEYGTDIWCDWIMGTTANDLLKKRKGGN